MSDNPQTYDDFYSQVGDLLQQLCDSINDAIKRIAGMLSSFGAGVSQVLGHLNPFGGDSVKHAIDKWNNEILPNILTMWDNLQNDIWTKVGDFTGRPTDLLDYSKSFNSVASTIYVPGSLAQRMVFVKDEWTGLAADSYVAVAGDQDAATQALAFAFAAGGTMTAGIANQILSLWKDMVQQFLEWTSGLLNCFKTASDAEDVLSFEVPAMFQLAATIVDNVAKLGATLAGYLITQITTTTNGWQQLAAGARGLPDNKWPAVLGPSSNAIDNPSDWKPTPIPNS